MNRLLTALASALLAFGAAAQGLDDLPPYRPERQVTDTLRIWGNDGQVENMKLWEEGFRKFHPNARFALSLRTTASAIGGLYAGAADLSLMGREIWPIEAQGFQKTTGHDLTSITVMTGSFDAAERTLAIGVFVHKDNPLARLTLAEVDAIFSSSRKRGHAPIRTWGDAGLTGEWAARPIHPMGYAIDSGFAFFLTQTAFKKGFNWVDGYTEFNVLVPPKVPEFTPADLACLRALALDRDGIAFAAMPFAGPGVKALALADEEKNPAAYAAFTRENVRNRSYPLLRDMIVVIDRVPGRPLDPKVREFLKYVLSREGQQAVVRQGDYLPLPLATLQAESKKLD